MKINAKCKNSALFRGVGHFDRRDNQSQVFLIDTIANFPANRVKNKPTGALLPYKVPHAWNRGKDAARLETEGNDEGSDGDVYRVVAKRAHAARMSDGHVRHLQQCSLHLGGVGQRDGRV